MNDEPEIIPPEKKRDGRIGNNHPNILEAQKRFGTPEGNANHYTKIEGANKPWSIRHSVRYLAGQIIDSTDKDAFKKLLPAKHTVAQLIAANSLAKATKADMRAVEYATEQIDGKLAQANLNGDLAALNNMTDEQLYEIIDQFNEWRERASTLPGGGGDGSGEDDPKPDGGAPAVGGEA